MVSEQILEAARREAEAHSLRAEIVRYEREILPSMLPYDGPEPRTLEEFRALPEPYRQQAQAANPDLILDLTNRRRILQRVAAAEQYERLRLSVLEGLPFKNMAELNALGEDAMFEWHAKLSPDQMQALGGVVPLSARREAEGYL